MINEISEGKRNYQNEYEQCKSNTNEKWKFINKMLNRQSSIDSIPQCLENGNEKVTSPQEIADTFNGFFTNMGEALAKSLPPANMGFEWFMPVKEGVQQTPEFKFLEIQEEITRDVIRNCHGKKAVGYNKISMSIIKENNRIFHQF